MLSVTAAASAALTIALTGVALADPPPPGNCGTGLGYENSRYAYCASGNGFVRVKLTCANDYTKRTTIYGKWVPVPNVPPSTVSSARCTSSYPYVMSVGYETKPL
ncbi:hypothetical protein ACQEUU_18490 [Nonomuraea sp. CA-218870]|uniref:hypothetical protein n=1 Tax=Nonomuraea sp. CA-218870 TaxID=3239998 RepID=UPI003D8E5DF6